MYNSLPCSSNYNNNYAFWRKLYIFSQRMQFHSPRGQIFSSHSSAFTIPTAGVCSLEVFLPFTVFFRWASLSGSFHVWSSASGNQILFSLNQFNQNFLFKTNILESLNLSETDGDRSFSLFWNFLIAYYVDNTKCQLFQIFTLTWHYQGYIND